MSDSAQIKWEIRKVPKRVVFSFDDRSLESLEKMTKQGRVPTSEKLPQYSGEYKEVDVTNPETGETQVIVIPVEECGDCSTAAWAGEFECQTCGREWS